MRLIVGCFACLTALSSLAFAAPESAAPLPAYHLHGYYQLHDDTGVWTQSDDSPWQVVRDEAWIEPYLVKWGYVPMTHDSKHYYCQIDGRPRTGTNINQKTFVCGDPETVDLLYNTKRKPTLLLYAGH